jgi:hypothetical protein
MPPVPRISRISKRSPTTCPTSNLAEGLSVVPVGGSPEKVEPPDVPIVGASEILLGSSDFIKPEHLVREHKKVTQVYT